MTETESSREILTDLSTDEAPMSIYEHSLTEPSGKEDEKDLESVSRYHLANPGSGKLMSLLDQLEEKLVRMEDVLNRIDSLNYGRCEHCNAEIEADLLSKDPLSRKCRNHLTGEAGTPKGIAGTV